MAPYLYEHANIREQVSWVHHGERATAKAGLLVAAAVGKARRLKPLSPVRVESRPHATVIGAGVAGLRAALDLSRRGLKVTLVEKSAYLGGRTARLDRLYPNEASAGEVVRSLAQAVSEDPRIDLRTCTEVIAYEGYVGNFRLTLRTTPRGGQATSGADGPEASLPPVGYVPFQGYHMLPADPAPSESTVQTGVIVMATGFQPYRPTDGEYGYAQTPHVVTLPEFIQRLAEAPSNRPTLEVQGRPVRRIAFIHCVGSRQIPGIHEPKADDRLNEYCSRTCCSTVLRTAVEVRERFPDTQVLDYYRDIRTYGRGQEAYYEQAAQANVLFFRFEADAPPVVEATKDGHHPLCIRVKDTLTFGETLSASVDLVVLAVGMEAQPIAELVEMMKLPTGMDGFLQEVHPKLRPVEVATSGILLAGTCQAPMDVTEACTAAQAAAVKASGLLAKGYVELDPFVAEVDATRCTGNGRCAEVCPIEGAVELGTEDGGKAVIHAALCTGCGICVAECPEQAIDIRGWSLEQYEAMVDAIVAA